ncbi:hypothetical protein Q7P36_001059 [Cladosporium allicinum]
MFKQTTSTSTSLSQPLSLFFHVPDLWRLDRRCSAIPEAIPTPRSTSLRACAQISAATPEAFVPSSLLPSRSTIINNDIIEFNLRWQPLTCKANSGVSATTLGGLGWIRRLDFDLPSAYHRDPSSNTHEPVHSQPRSQEVRIVVVVAAYILHSASTFRAVAHTNASPRLYASVRAEDNFRPMVVARCLET